MVENINPIRDHLQKSKVRRKAHNAAWWTENNQANKLRAEIRRISEAISRLDGLKQELYEREVCMSTIAASIKTEDDFQAELKSKLSEVAAAKRLLKRFPRADSTQANSLIPGIPNGQLLIRREGGADNHGS